jgi:parallel beta-helix repeat protein
VLSICDPRRCRDVTITDNEVAGCAQGIFAATAAPSTDLTIRDNLTYANGVGIFLIQVEDSQLTGNQADMNEWAGLALVQFSQGNRILSNIATEGTTLGRALQHSRGET